VGATVTIDQKLQEKIMENIKVPVSPGEVLDKITILEIKSERMEDAEKVANVRVELKLLQDTWAQNITDDDVIRDLHAQLKEINEALWEIEDDIRDKERVKEFDERFIEIARAVYFTNDKRSEVKKKLNLHLGSEIVEEKSYQDYA
jgi:transcriptional regulator of nitric oxide reductase